jgi:hypothetical protein
MVKVKVEPAGLDALEVPRRRTGDDDDDWRRCTAETLLKTKKA